MKALRLLLPAAAVLVAAGCSGLKTYPNDAPRNLHVATQTDSSAKAALHVHEVTGPCATRYAGTLQLDAPKLDVGIPAGRTAYLVVTFDTSSFLGGSRATSVSTVLEPRAGFEYELAVRYKQAIYDVALREVDSRKRVSRELPRRSLAGC